jgi:hypothetical protein
MAQVAAAVVASASILAAGPAAAGAASVAADRIPATFQQGTPAGEPIPLTPLSGLSSLDATVDITVDGTIAGKPTQGGLTATLASNDQGMSQIVVTGSLLGDVVAQVGGSAVKLFRPKKVSIYSVPEGTYVVVGGFFDVCFKPEDSQATEALQQLSPQGLMTTLTSSDVARGTFVADEELDGRPVKHYRIDGEAFLAAAQGSSDATVAGFAQSLRSAADSDLYVAVDGGYPVAYGGAFNGAFAPLQFDGDLVVDIRLTGINGNTPVTLPGACDHPVSG